MADKRFSSSDWIALGLAELRTNGPEALTIDALCEAAAKTRGSFYFHFDSVEAFQLAIADDWLQRYTVELTAKMPRSSQRTDLLNELAGRLDLQLETSIRQLALANRRVGQIVMEADDARVNWLARCYRATGQYSDRHAAQLAKIEIAAFTGFRLIDPHIKAAEARELYEAFLELTGRS